MTLTSFQQTHHAAGIAPDTVPMLMEFEPPCMRIDIGVFDNTLLISFSSDKIFYGTERELPAGIFLSLDEWVHAVRIRNKVPGSAARFDLTGYYNPVEIIGEAPQPIMKV
jgi:hypothetical protein